jgi:ferredoxin
MNKLIEKVKTLLANSEIDLFIGYEKGTKQSHPFFAKSAEDAERLLLDSGCRGNLAVYLTRKDLLGGKKVGIAASYFYLRSISQLFKENQLKKELLRIFAQDIGGQLIELESVESINEYLLQTPPPVHPNDEVLLRQLETMTREERWRYWKDELSKCFKCYACRAACPMCYCTKCIVEENRPQWIQPWPTSLSNMEWQINRVMHLAGRCSDCGSCGDACPVGIPIHLLARHIAGTVRDEFGDNSGRGNALSTYKPEDHETFIR